MDLWGRKHYRRIKETHGHCRHWYPAYWQYGHFLNPWKPIIDIVIGVRELNDIQPYINVLKESGFIFRGEDVPGQVLFVKGNFEEDLQTHHIHVVKWNGSEWNNYINFRDYLNAFPEKDWFMMIASRDYPFNFHRIVNAIQKGKES